MQYIVVNKLQLALLSKLPQGIKYATNVKPAMLFFVISQIFQCFSFMFYGTGHLILVGGGSEIFGGLTFSLTVEGGGELVLE